MATRLYLLGFQYDNAGTLPSGEESAATANLYGTQAGTLQLMHEFKANAQLTGLDPGTGSVVNNTAGTTKKNAFMAFWASLPLAQDQTVGGGNIIFNCADQEASLDSNFWINTLNIYVWRPSTGTKVGTLRDAVGTSLGGTESTTISTYQVTHITGITSSAVSALKGDIIVVEAWSTFTPSVSNTTQLGMSYGGSTVNTTENSAAAGSYGKNHASFIEFSETLVFGTKLYLHDEDVSGGLQFAPTPSGWTGTFHVNETVIHGLATTKDSASTRLTAKASQTGTNWSFWGMFVSPPLAADCTIGHSPMQLVTAGYTSDISISAFTISNPYLYVWRPSTGEVVGTIYSKDKSAYGGGYLGGSGSREFSLLLNSYGFYPLTAINALAGDVLVLEVWTSHNVTNTSVTNGHTFGGSTDVAISFADGSNAAAYLQINDLLTFSVPIYAAINGTNVVGTGAVGSFGFTKSGSVALSGVSAEGRVDSFVAHRPTEQQLQEVTPLSFNQKFSPLPAKWRESYWGLLPDFHFYVEPPHAETEQAQESAGTARQNHRAYVAYLHMTVPAGVPSPYGRINTAQSSDTNTGWGGAYGVRQSGVYGTGHVYAFGHETSVALTGVQGTTAVQALGVVLVATLTSLVARGRFGSFLVHGSEVRITGNAAAGAVETMGHALTLDGVLGLGQVGNLTVGTAILGKSATGRVGTLRPGVQISAIGNAATGAVDAVVVATTVHLHGVSATGIAGNLLLTRGLTGVEAAGGVGTAVAKARIALTGVQAQGGVGTFTHTVYREILGNRGTGLLGAMKYTFSLRGTAGTGEVGYAAPAHENALAGVLGALAGGEMAPGLSYELGGVSATGFLGAMIESIEVELTGVEGAGTVSPLRAAPTLYLVGNEARSELGEVDGSTHHVWVPLTGVQATGGVSRLWARQRTLARCIIVPPDTLFGRQDLSIMEAPRKVA